MIKLIKRLACIGAVFLMAAGGLQGVATNRYVATNVPGSAYPFDSWVNAGTNIIEVVAVANANSAANAAGDIVFVSNGTYYLTNQIAVSNTVVTNFSGDRTKVIINGNYPTTTNRCFYVNHANAIVSGFTITNGYANTNNDLGHGGGVHLWKGTVKDCLITGNRSVVTSSYTYGGGGGINIYYGTADCCSVVGNVVEGQEVKTYPWSGGGGIALNLGGMVTNCYVAYNTATNMIGGEGFGGGGIWARDNGDKILSCTIVGNAAGGAGTAYGGGILCNGDQAVIQNCIIISNTCDGHGVGIYINGIVQIRNCLIAYNKGYELTTAHGGGIYLPAGNAIIESCTIVSNRFDTGNGNGGGICFGRASGYTNCVWNCIIRDNYAGKTTGGKDLKDDNDGPCYTAVVYSCTSPGSGFNIIGGITNSPPLFVDAVNWNYHLRQDSPCINKGTNRVWMTDAVDYDGNPRIRYGTTDMGAYEYISPGTVYKFH